MQLSEILEGIRHAQTMQDLEGKDHPGQVFAFTFPATYAEQLLLGKIEGLEFVPAPDGRGLTGCFKPLKREASA